MSVKLNTDLIAMCEAVLAAKIAGKKSITLNGVTFDDNIYDGNGGRCQENARKIFEAVTNLPMPGKACCAGKTYLNLREKFTNLQVAGGTWDEDKLTAGDYLFFGGGPKCKTCGNPVGHVGIWMSHDRMFQHTSRANLGITQEGPTTDQKARFSGAFRLLKIGKVVEPLPEWAKSSISWVTGEGLLSLDSEGKFNPNRNVTRAELAVILARMANRGG